MPLLWPFPSPPALARLEPLDVGKPLKQGRADAVALARYLEFYGGAADRMAQDANV